MRRFLKYVVGILAFLIFVLVITAISYYQKGIAADILIKKYCNTEDRFMPLMGMQVHYRDEGNQSDSIPIILIHGTASSLFTWDSAATILKEKHRVIRFDLPAFALTGPSPEKDYSMAYYNQFVDSLLIRWNIHQCVLIGNSLGGSIAWQYSLQHPAKVAKLVLVDAGGIVSSVKPKGSTGFKIAQMPVLSSLLKYITPKFLVIRSLHEVYGDPSKVKDWEENRYFDMLVREGNREALVSRLKSNVPLDESENIRKIKTPTLIIWGDLDQLIPVENAGKFHTLIANSDLEIMKGIGHIPMEESPAFFAQRVGMFIDKK